MTLLSQYLKYHVMLFLYFSNSFLFFLLPWVSLKMADVKAFCIFEKFKVYPGMVSVYLVSLYQIQILNKKDKSCTSHRLRTLSNMKRIR